MNLIIALPPFTSPRLASRAKVFRRVDDDEATAIATAAGIMTVASIIGPDGETRFVSHPIPLNAVMLRMV